MFEKIVERRIEYRIVDTNTHNETSEFEVPYAEIILTEDEEPSTYISASEFAEEAINNMGTTAIFCSYGPHPIKTVDFNKVLVVKYETEEDDEETEEILDSVTYTFVESLLKEGGVERITREIFTCCVKHQIPILPNLLDDPEEFKTFAEKEPYKGYVNAVNTFVEKTLKEVLCPELGYKWYALVNEHTELFDGQTFDDVVIDYYGYISPD